MIQTCPECGRSDVTYDYSVDLCPECGAGMRVRL